MSGAFRDGRFLAQRIIGKGAQAAVTEEIQGEIRAIAAARGIFELAGFTVVIDAATKFDREKNEAWKSAHSRIEKSLAYAKLLMLTPWLRPWRDSWFENIPIGV